MARTTEVSILNMFQEMQTWLHFSDSILSKAKESTITTTNNKKLKSLVDKWRKGVYDEDPDGLGNELESLVLSTSN